MQEAVMFYGNRYQCANVRLWRAPSVDQPITTSIRGRPLGSRICKANVVCAHGFLLSTYGIVLSPPFCLKLTITIGSVFPRDLNGLILLDQKDKYVGMAIYNYNREIWTSSVQ